MSSYREILHYSISTSFLKDTQDSINKSHSYPQMTQGQKFSLNCYQYLGFSAQRSQLSSDYTEPEVYKLTNIN